MALIVGTTLPLATIAGILAWHAYVATADNSFTRTESDAASARYEIIRDIERTRSSLETLSDIGLSQTTAARAFFLVQSVSLGRYCFLALLDGQEKIVASLDTSDSHLIACAGSQLKLSQIIASSKTAILPNQVQTSVVIADRVPLVRFLIPVTYSDEDELPNLGYLVAVKPLVSSQMLSAPQFSATFAAEKHESGTQLWLFSDGLEPILLTHQHLNNAPWPREVLERVRSDRAAGVVADNFHSGSTFYTLTTGIDSISLIAVSERSLSEAHALHLFLARVFLIALLLVIELLLVAIAAHSYLVEPLERLAHSVADWRRNGTFQPDLPYALPLEIRHLERAFSRATRRLGRHEARLRKAARQQDVLIREIHHRVKNNLQIVASLLNLQANRIRLPEAKVEFRLIRDRVRALATLHRYLYTETGVSSVDIKAFLEELCSQILTAHNQSSRDRVTLSLSIGELSITPDQAVPLSLIVTEVLSNALRYAFPAGQKGEITISMMSENHLIVLVMSDNGIGFADKAAASAGDRKREGIGLQLIRGFARQLQATLDISSDQGTRYELRFPEIRKKETIGSALAQTDDDREAADA